VSQATAQSGQSQVSLFRPITGGDVGTSYKSTKQPFSGPYPSTVKIYERPISVPQATGQSGQSQISLYRPITGQFILINLRRYTNPAGKIHGNRNCL